MGEIRRLPVKPRLVREQTIEPEALNPGLFTIAFNNRKKQGRGFQSHTCQGSLYGETGHVHLDTDVLPNNTFHSMQEMVDCLEEFGDCLITEGNVL